ncbi:glutamate--cysteine ligase [Candidatus Accumulibacter phosphatis]|jgi:carboxylate-amine ligase|uniref:Putative glutamate--cysteine ligase 2 n=1 Tax=Candidatus Accumulibacter phosphatis TaxID=327160 RepID=A0ABX1TQ96_9PROT|nr:MULTISPECIES: YbdK family carboxylate-amine ligase [Candidatus Accumulibacter]NMQ26401.1 glutamate--cysteine ligase [Candidatus Accumulibacter phosphatis]
MPLESFKASASLSMGVELELQLVNWTDFDLSGSASDLLHLLGHKTFPGDVKPEITESMLEISTAVHHRHAELLAQLRDIRDALVRTGDRLNIAVCGGGTHPFQRWSERRIFPNPRFNQLSTLYGYLAKQFTVFGQHIHIGCTSANEALYLLHSLNRYVPHFIALSASSPFFQGIDTQFDSARLNSVFAFPLSGRAPLLFDWQEFAHHYFAKMETTGVVKSMKDFYWDIRPKPEYGTIELRVCDTPLTVDRAAALAAYLQALCRMLLQRDEAPPVEDDYLVYNYNRFQACRFGLDGVLVHPKSHESRLLRQDILATLARLEPHAAVLDSIGALEQLRHEVSAEGNHASFLRQHFADAGSVQGVVDAAVTLFRRGRSR